MSANGTAMRCAHAQRTTACVAPPYNKNRDRPHQRLPRGPETARSGSRTGGTVSRAGESREVLEWLWETAAEPVLCTLGYRIAAPRRMGVARRACGHLVAARACCPSTRPAITRIRPPGPARRTVMDRVVSSYTPTVRALRYARKQDTSVAAPGRSLIVAMLTTRASRATSIRPPPKPACSPAACPTRYSWPNLASRAAARSAPGGHARLKTNRPGTLPRSPIAHFACDGTSDPAARRRACCCCTTTAQTLSPSRASPLSNSGAELAYLSACGSPLAAPRGYLMRPSTSLQHSNSPGSGIRRHPVEIDDAVAITIADAFYSGLRSPQGTMDTSRAAHALHHAVRAVRDGIPATPSLWASYLHAGA